tara:strand:- start:807 stop:3140 length:2334 start_codon:yes stop_codon:yes gene_type:complete
MLVTRICRPIKIGFVVNPNDGEAIRRAIEINTFLWGGQFNPLLPLYKRKPTNWSDLPIDNFDRHAVLRGYISVFDPDLVVPVGDVKLDRSATDCRRVIPLENILGNVEQHGAPNIGMGLFDVLKHLIATELRYVRSRPIRFKLPSVSGPHALFLDAMFGSLNRKVRELFNDSYADRLGIEEADCDYNNFVAFLEPDNLFLRRISSLFLRTQRNRHWGREGCVFLCDSERPSDVLDYWNLRALGWNVLPVPRKAAGEEAIKDYVGGYVEATYTPYRSNPDLFAHTTVLKSRTCSEDEVRSFVESLNLAKPSDERHPKVTMQSWYPRMWDRTYWQADDTHCCSIEAGEIKSEHPDAFDEVMRFSVAAPLCIDDLRMGTGPKFANRVSVQSYSSSTPLAEVMPECDNRMCEAIQTHDRRQWRFSENGMVYLPHHSIKSIWMSPPDSQQVFLKWMEWQGWDVKQSSTGRLTSQLFSTLGGIHGIGLIANNRLLKLLTKISGSCLSREEVMAEVHQIVNEGHLFCDGTHFVERLIEREILRLGVRIQCPTCTQRSWHSLTEIDYTIRCPRCEDTFDVPSGSQKDMIWAYRARGAFDMPNQAQGAYCVLLLARFFSELYQRPTTPIFGMEASKGSTNIEVDYGAITKYETVMEQRTATVLAECKTFNRFQAVDFKRMKVLGNVFNDTVLVFATLNDSLTDKERRSIIPLVKRCRREYKAHRKNNHVLILTANELLAQFGPPYCWEDLEGVFEPHAKRQDVSRDLETLSQATQHLYLGLDPEIS